jgi:hypothetical protein
MALYRSLCKDSIKCGVKMRLFCFGFGYVAHMLAADLRTQGWHVAGTHRGHAEPPFYTLHDDSALDANGHHALRNATHILVSIPPTGQGVDAAWKHHADSMQGKWVGYLSTTGVYGDWQGAWVNETSALKATEPRSVRRIQAEQNWLELGANIFRLAGIYGPKRNVFADILAEKATRLDKPGQYFSRIHVADISRILQLAMQQNTHAETFNLCDDEPAPSHEVIAYACSLLGKNPPPLIAFEDAQLSDMAKSFYASNRRVNNDKIKDFLGVKLLFPNYRVGLASILHSKQ